MTTQLARPSEYVTSLTAEQGAALIAQAVASNPSLLPEGKTLAEIGQLRLSVKPSGEWTVVTATK